MFLPLLQAIAHIGSWGGLIALTATVLCLLIALMFLCLYGRFERRKIDLLFAWMAASWALLAFCGWMVVMSDAHWQQEQNNTLLKEASAFWLRMEFVAGFIVMAALVHFVQAFLERSPVPVSLPLVYGIALTGAVMCFSPLFSQPPPRAERFFAVDRSEYIVLIGEQPGVFYYVIVGVLMSVGVLMPIKLWSAYRRVRESEGGAVAHEMRLVGIGLLMTVICSGIDAMGNALRVVIVAVPLFHPIGESTFCILTAVALIREMARTAAERSALAAKVQQAQEIAERAIAGGMAHEIRNAVGGSVLVLSHLRDQELFSRSRAELEELFEKLKSQRERLNEDFPRMAQQCALIASALEEAEGAMEVVLSNDERAVALTSRVLDLSRVERALGAETVDVHALVREVVEGAHHSHPNVEMVAQCNGDGVFRGHADLLFAVIQNLLLNAVDAVMRQPEEGNRRVVVNSTLDSTSGRDSWRLMVADNGVGINAEQKAHIFDPFYSAKPQRGTGLGLYLVRRVVSAYHGEIRVESEEGKGTTFTLYLPLRSVSDLLTAARSPERGADTAASPDNASADAKTIASLGTQ